MGILYKPDALNCAKNHLHDARNVTVTANPLFFTDTLIGPFPHSYNYTIAKCKVYTYFHIIILVTVMKDAYTHLTNLSVNGIEC